MKVGGKEAVKYGTIVTLAGDSVVDLTFEDLTYRLIFELNPSIQEPQALTKINTDHLEMRLVNFNDPLGTAWQGHIGNLINSRRLYLSIVVHNVGSNPAHLTRSIAFTFSTEVA
jgi:hypothetical protein